MFTTKFEHNGVKYECKAYYYVGSTPPGGDDPSEIEPLELYANGRKCTDNEISELLMDSSFDEALCDATDSEWLSNMPCEIQEKERQFGA